MVWNYPKYDQLTSRQQLNAFIAGDPHLSAAADGAIIRRPDGSFMYVSILNQDEELRFREQAAAKSVWICSSALELLAEHDWLMLPVDGQAWVRVVTRDRPDAMAQLLMELKKTDRSLDTFYKQAVRKLRARA